MRKSTRKFLRIKWLSGFELVYVQLDPQLNDDEIKHNEIKQTAEYWPTDDRLVMYNTTSERRINKKDGTQQITIHYSEENNRTLLKDLGKDRLRYMWGTSTINVDKNLNRVKASWEGKAKNADTGKAQGVEVLPQNPYLIEEH